MSMRNDCPRFSLYQHLFAQSTRLQTALCNYYTIVIKFCTQVLQVGERTALVQVRTTLWKPFDAEFGKFRNDLQQQCGEVQKEITLAAEHAAERERQLQEQERGAMVRFRFQGELIQQERMRARLEMTKQKSSTLYESWPNYHSTF